MILFCGQCGKKGSLEVESYYYGKRLRLKCPYCSFEFVYALPPNDSSSLEPEEAGSRQGIEARPEVEAAVFEAKRIARLIISEIKLYNQEKIERAGSQTEVLELLKSDLRKGKDHYYSRIASRLPQGPDYFMESVREILLAGKN